jgi:cytochrome c-type biogenesis protein CcmE
MRLRKQQRLILVVLALLLLGGAGGLVLFALSDSVAFFVTPSDIAAGKVDPDKRFRLGGLVVAGSVERPGNDGLVLFRVTDQVSEVPVRYRGELGGDGVFTAGEVLAKHDENYMPPEVAEALKRAGVWRHAAGAGEKP